MPGRSDAIERSQKKLYLSLKSELAFFEKKKSRELRAYENSFRASLPKSGKPIEKHTLLEKCGKAQVVLVGDFHPFRQSQKGFLRLLEGAAQHATRPVVALECLQQKAQKALDQYLAGYITAEELRDESDFEKHWPFSWSCYREIFAFAKQKGLALLALNKSLSLKERDKAAAEVINATIRKHPRSTVFVLYGELHLAPAHLPKYLKAKELIVVHQNISTLYWNAKKLKNGQRPEILQLRKNEFCILNSVPWIKLRSYLDWLEGSPEGEYGEDEIDAAGIIHHYAVQLAHALELPSKIADDTEIFTPAQFASGKLPSSLGDLDKFDSPLANHALAFQRPSYLPEARALLLPAFSTNSLSEAASLVLLHSRLKGSGHRLDPSTLVSLFLVGYLGSKVLNPKRKCNEVADLKLQLEQLKKKKRNPAKQEVLARALALLAPYLKKEALPKKSKAASPTHEIEACRLAGFILGERLFSSLLKRPALLGSVRAWYQAESTAALKKQLAATAKNIKLYFVPPTSKRDRF